MKDKKVRRTEKVRKSQPKSSRPLSPGARQLPLAHISIRVPWNDTGWEGCVCANPRANNSCLVLPRISEGRDDDLEMKLAGRSWADLAETERPICASERGAFMAPFDLTKHMEHPYFKTNEQYKHFAQTPFTFKAYSAAAVPFRWMLCSWAGGDEDEKGGNGVRSTVCRESSLALASDLPAEQVLWQAGSLKREGVSH